MPLSGENLQDTLRAKSNVQHSTSPHRLIVISCGRASVHVLAADGAVLLGRSSFANVMVDDPSISRRHALIRIDRGRTTIEDLGSVNGTRIGERNLTPGTAVEVHPGEPIDLGSVTVVLSHAASKCRESEAISQIVLVDRRMREICKLLERIAPSNLSVLLLGETGVGKEVLAKRIHDLSGRSGPYLELHCAAFAETLLETELFGHEEGSFTGAAKRKLGLLESAEGGTVLLDEVGELPATMQVKLLRVLESKHVTRVGALRSKSLDIRFLAATNRDLDAEVEAGRFRRDLFFRLKGISIYIPPLRARSSEIEPLARSFLRAFCLENNLPEPELSPEALERLVAHQWPGNLRELRHTIEGAVLVASEAIRPEHLPFEKTAVAQPTRATPKAIVGPLKPEVAALEKDAILGALERCAGNQSEAAKVLGISRRTLGGRMDLFGISRPRKLRSGS